MRSVGITLVAGLCTACRAREAQPNPPDAAVRAVAVAVAPSASVPAPLSVPRTLTVLATGQNHPRFVAASASAVFFSAYEASRLQAVPKKGGALTTLVEDAEDAYGVATDGDVVVVAGRTLEGAVWRAPLRGGRPAIVARAEFPSAVALDHGDVYWVTRDTVERARLDGRDRTIVARGQAGPHGLAARGGTAYWSNYHGGSVATSSGGGRVLASGLANPAGIALAGEEVIVACTGDGTVRGVALADGGAARVLASGLSYPSEVAVDAAFAYVTTASGSVLKIPLAGGAPIVLAEGQLAPAGIAVDDESVYFAAEHAGSIVKITPK